MEAQLSGFEAWSTLPVIEPRHIGRRNQGRKGICNAYSVFCSIAYVPSVQKSTKIPPSTAKLL